MPESQISTVASANANPKQEVNSSGQRVLCRTENYADCHDGLGRLLRSEGLLRILERLSGEPMVLFKEKINYKLAGSGQSLYQIPSGRMTNVRTENDHNAGGFAPHIDAVAYTHVKMIKHLTILLAVDESSKSNGCLEVVARSHELQIPIREVDHCIEYDWVDEQTWTPVELEAGKLLVQRFQITSDHILKRPTADLRIVPCPSQRCE